MGPIAYAVEGLFLALCSSWILGVSLGDERILRLENPSCPEERYELPLPSGSVYLQRSVIRASL